MFKKIFYIKFINLVRILFKKLKFYNNYLFVRKNIYKKTFSRSVLIFHKLDFLIYSDVVSQFKHTNNYEVQEISKIFDSLGYNVDIVDVANKSHIPNDFYSVIIGLAAGNNGNIFLRLCNFCLTKNPNIKIFPLCMGPDPYESNMKIEERYQSFSTRFGLKSFSKKSMMRIINNPCFETISKLSTALIVIGQKNSFSYNTYTKYSKPIIEYFPAIYKPALLKNSSKRTNNFLCLVGNGFIVKGVDLLVEAFLKMPELNLTIAGPKGDALFEQFYDEKIAGAKNIKFIGFVDIASDEFLEVVENHTFGILASCSEGMCTSVMTMMSFGLITIFTKETSIILGNNYPFLLSDFTSDVDLIIEIKNMCRRVSLIGDSDLTQYKIDLLNFINNFQYDKFQANFILNTKDFLL